MQFCSGGAGHMGMCHLNQRLASDKHQMERAGQENDIPQGRNNDIDEDEEQDDSSKEGGWDEGIEQLDGEDGEDEGEDGEVGVGERDMGKGREEERAYENADEDEDEGVPDGGNNNGADSMSDTEADSEGAEDDNEDSFSNDQDTFCAIGYSVL